MNTCELFLTFWLNLAKCYVAYPIRSMNLSHKKVVSRAAVQELLPPLLQESKYKQQ